MALICVTTLAQQNRLKKGEHRKEMKENRSDLSPEQMAELSTKKMTLHLDLTDKQQKEVKSLHLEKAKKRKERQLNKKDRTSISDKERFEMKSKRLDEQIATKKQLKSILTEEQYEKLHKEHETKSRRMRSHHKKYRAPADKQ